MKYAMILAVAALATAVGLAKVNSVPVNPHVHVLRPHLVLQKPTPRPQLTPVPKPTDIPFNGVSDKKFEDWTYSWDKYLFDQECRKHRLGGFLSAYGHLNIMDTINCEHGTLHQSWR